MTWTLHLAIRTVRKSPFSLLHYRLPFVWKKFKKFQIPRAQLVKRSNNEFPTFVLQSVLSYLLAAHIFPAASSSYLLRENNYWVFLCDGGWSLLLIGIWLVVVTWTKRLSSKRSQVRIRNLPVIWIVYSNSVSLALLPYLTIMGLYLVLCHSKFWGHPYRPTLSCVAGPIGYEVCYLQYKHALLISQKNRCNVNAQMIWNIWNYQPQWVCICDAPDWPLT